MKKKILIFLVFLFLTINSSSAALSTSDVEVTSEISNSTCILDEVTAEYGSNTRFMVTVTNWGRTPTNVVVNETVPSEMEIVKYEATTPGRGCVVNCSTYNTTSGLWSFNLPKYADASLIIYLKNTHCVADMVKTTSLVNSTVSDPNPDNNQATVILHTYRRYLDYYIEPVRIHSDSTFIRYQINGLDKWYRNIQASALGIQKYTILAQDMRSKKLFAINKFTGTDRWTLILPDTYNRLQLIGGKYAVFMNKNGFVQLNLNTKKIVTGKTYDSTANEYYGLIKSKKNGNYYVMTITDGIFKFFKLKVIQ